MSIDNSFQYRFKVLMHELKKNTFQYMYALSQLSILEMLKTKQIKQ